MTKAITNLEFKGLLEGILANVAENTSVVREKFVNVETKITAVDMKVSALDAQVTLMDGKLDDIMKQLEKMNKTIASNAGKKQSGYVYYETKEYEFKFACGHKVTMKHKKYVNTQARCRELDIKFCCPTCSKKAAIEKYSEFYTQMDRLPNAEELKQMKEAFKAEREALQNEYASIRAERKAAQEQLNFERKKAYFLSQGIDLDLPENAHLLGSK